MSMTPLQIATRNTALRCILVDTRVHNEQGDLLRDFVNREHDAEDFATVSRGTLYDLMVMAYEAGMKAK